MFGLLRSPRLDSPLPGLLLVVSVMLPAQSLWAEDGARPAAGTPDKGTIDFRRDIYPILSEHCFDCHQGSDADSGVRLDLYDKLLGRLDGKALVVPGQSDKSLLVQLLLSSDEDEQMPPADAGERLSPAQIALVRGWIDQGVAWDELLLPPLGKGEGAKHWAFQRVKSPAIPKIEPNSWSRNPIDVLIAAEHKKHGLKPSPQAPRHTLLRRLTLTLLGLPPSESQIARFNADRKPGAYERLVDRLLESSHYGERWGRHWLDVARFAESEGYAENTDWPHFWRYRDYVVDSFNRDRPYSQFMRQQIAGDEMVPYAAENLIATGFLAAARISGDDADCVRQHNDLYVDMVNATSTALLGLTMACAQCHDHKFDPISHRDYYRFQAFFTKGLPGNLVLRPPAANDELAGVSQQLRSLTFKVQQRVLEKAYQQEAESTRVVMAKTESQRSMEQEALFRETRSRLNIQLAGCNGFRIKPEEKKQLDALKARLTKLAAGVDQTWGFYSPVASPHPLSVLPMQSNFPLLHITERLASRRTYLLSRGSPYRPVALVKSGWPAVFGPSPLAASSARPRSVLADWLGSRDNPLSARVWVNRIWHYHFGRGIVTTPGNFGLRGTPPTHPKLLDFLAAELMDNHWSTKHIQRLIVTSSVYRQTANFDKDQANLDPANRFFWRWPRRRLEAEAIRDSMLAVSGELNTRGGGPSDRSEAASMRRSLYLFQKRDKPPEMQALFDGPADMSASCGKRNLSVSALQPLYLLNNRASITRARSLAARILKKAGDNPAAQIDAAFLWTLGRSPETRERQDAMAFLTTADESSVADAADAPDEVTEPIGRRLGLWLRADAGVMHGDKPAIDGDPVAKWQDQRFGDNKHSDDAVQSAAAQRPILRDNPSDNISGLPVIRFAGGAVGTADHLLEAEDSDELDLTDSYTLFSVVRFAGPGQGNGVVLLKGRHGGSDVGSYGLLRLGGQNRPMLSQNIGGTWGDRLAGKHSVKNGQAVLLVGQWDGKKIVLDVYDGLGQISHDEAPLAGQIDPGKAGRLGIGGYIDAFSAAGERMSGDIGEVLIYRTALSDDERQTVRRYLQGRWFRDDGQLSRLAAFCQVMMNLNEFVYIE